MIRKRWTVNREGRWPYGSTIVAIFMTWVAGTSPCISVHWDLQIPDWIAQNIRKGLDDSYQGEWTNLPFRRICRLPHATVYRLLAGDDNTARFDTWLEQVMVPRLNTVVLMCAHDIFHRTLLPDDDNNGGATSSSA